MVPSFRPGVREVNVKTIDGVVGDGFGEELGGICSDYPYVFETPSADAVDGVAVVFSGTFYTEEVKVRAGPGLVQEEGGLSSADLDVEGCSTSENVGEVDFSIQIFGP